MTKQEQIEEISKIACVACLPHNCCPILAKFRPCEAALEYAKAVYDGGYRKADGVRKETAKEILDMLYNNIERKQFFETYIKTLARTYGVEIEK